MTGSEWRALARELWPRDPLMAIDFQDFDDGRVVVCAVMGTGPDAIVAHSDIPKPKSRYHFKDEFCEYIDEVKRIVGRTRADALRQFFERWDARLLAEPLGLKTLTEEA